MPSPQLPASAPQSPVVEKAIRHASSATTLHLPISQQDSSDTAIRELPLTKEVFETAQAMKKDAADASMNVLETSVSTDPTLTDAEAQAATYLLMKWDELPDWRRDNEFVVTGYRHETNSVGRSLRSIFKLHNETRTTPFFLLCACGVANTSLVNIYSHLLGALLFALLPIYIYCVAVPRMGDAKVADLVVFGIFFFGVACCFSLSSLEKVAKIWLEFDFLGIVVLMWGSMVPTVYHGFVCDPKLQKIYWSMITLFAFSCILITLIPAFRTPTFRVYRTLMYAGLGLSALVFIIHSIAIYGWNLQYHRLSLEWIAAMAGLNFVGALAYSLRIPEKWYPGKFDIYGNSHQILHTMVVLAALAHFAGLVDSFDYLHNVVDECPA
ncbi:hemolysin-III channel Izh2 protein [Rutstroemia sp. NJR-2017a WRK4]|nr:hemolysin-III channel Izh2 protein [Rutstroemia sp. NJR-2017a WRK4]